MKSFIHHTLEQLEKHHALESFTYVVPNRRSVAAIYSALAEKNDAPIWAPECLTIDELLVDISGYTLLSSTDQLFELYEVYHSGITPSERIGLKAFQNLGKLLLQDFNEIDQGLCDPRQLFNDLEQLVTLDTTFAPEEQTELMQSHLSRIRRISKVYEDYVARCDSLRRAHQGLLYRRAFEHVSSFCAAQTTPLVFIGFNAFSKAEQEIVHTLLKEVSGSKIFWDIDWNLLQDAQHEAALFIRRYRSEWTFLEEQRPFSVFKENDGLFRKDRAIEIVDAPGALAQCHALNELLSHKKSLESTVVVLADEDLLEAVLQTLTLDATQGSLNITMGNALANTPTAGLIRSYLAMRNAVHEEGEFVNSNALRGFIEHPFLPSAYLEDRTFKLPKRVHVKRSLLHAVDCFSPSDTIEEEFQRLLSLLNSIPTKTAEVLSASLEGHKGLIVEHAASASVVEPIEVVFNELLGAQKINYKGDPENGLQLMGILETRNLDFETVIVLSVNEKVLPKGRSYGSLLPYDLRKAYDIPTYKEKDAIYTYYFYRLIKGASEVHLFYNGQMGAFDAKEKSRYIYQLELEPRLASQIKYRSVYFDAKSNAPNGVNSVPKSDAYFQALKAHLSNGVSASSLLSFLHHQDQFYSSYLLGIRQTEEIGPQMPANLLGTLIHDALDQLYTPLLGATLSQAALKQLALQIDQSIAHAYTKNELSNQAEDGRSILIYDVVKAYVLSVVASDLSEVEKGHSIRLLSLEDTYYATLKLPIQGLATEGPIRLKGKIDRIDEIDGILRITDYKTGAVKTSDVKFESMDESLLPAKEKVFQLLFYTLLLGEHEAFTSYFNRNAVQASVFSTKHRGHYYLTQQKERFKAEPSALKECLQLVHAQIEAMCSKDPFEIPSVR